MHDVRVLIVRIVHGSDGVRTQALAQEVVSPFNRRDRLRARTLNAKLRRNAGQISDRNSH